MTQIEAGLFLVALFGAPPMPLQTEFLLLLLKILQGVPTQTHSLPLWKQAVL